MKRLIINADDYGTSPGVSAGIREAHLRGIVTSTTCMMNLPGTAAEIAIALRETPDLGLGVHLVLTKGSPLSAPGSVPSLVDEDGRFFKRDPLLERLRLVNAEEAKLEWRAQIEAFIQAAGKKPTHLDSHHHSSYFSPSLFRAMLELAAEYDCAIRSPFTEIPRELEETAGYLEDLVREFKPRRPEVFFVDFYDEGVTQEQLIKILASLRDGVSEIMCHPGYVDEAFAKESIYNVQRERELKILTDPSIREAVESQNIKLISFAEL